MVKIMRSAFFLPVLAVLAGSPAAEAAQSEAQTQATYEKLQDQLKAEVKSDQLEIEKLKGDLRVRLKSELLFAGGKWEIGPKGQATLERLAKSLVATVHDTKIVVEGYTDDAPIHADLKKEGVETNLDLSSRRADAVADLLRKQGISEKWISAQGFGDEHPRASNKTAEGRAMNRRIEVVLVGNGG